ncbi:transglycosylase domain-containing protein [Candidatus Dojkabacteria bacterium]|nr:transglycosylase domain-containing protein [Candidatus Dojkabacteria bacterium]
MKYRYKVTNARNSGNRITKSVHGRGSKSFKYRKIKRYSPSRKKSPAWKFGSLKKLGGPKFKKTASKVLGVFLGIGVLVTIGVSIFVGATLASIKKSLPGPNELIDWESAESTEIYDRGGPDDGELLYTIYGDQNREFVDIEEIPNETKWALLAAEDVEFYDHKGLDIPGIIKAAYQNIVLNQTRGASTISQQLVRNTLLFKILGDQAYERTLTRKAKEALITMQLEQTMTKDEILQMYMNEIPLGGTNYGYQAASKAYFGKDVSELSLAESALLAGLIQAPGAYSPLFGSNPEDAVERQHFVLDQMYEKRDYIQKTSKKHGEEIVITKEMIEEAKNEEIIYKEAELDIPAPHFVFYVKQLLIEKYGIDRVQRGGLKVTTTLDSDLQKIAEEEIKAGVNKYRAPYNVYNGGMVVIDPRTGQIMSMVGSYDYNTQDESGKIDGKVNVTTALRQMGSSVKPYTYLTAFHKGYSPALLTPDIPFNFGYKAKNWDGQYKGLMLARQALVESRNIPALYTMDLIGGPDEFIKTAETLGITTLTERDRYGLSLTLGAGEMKLLEHTAAFGAFANGGKMHPTTPFLKVETSKGEVLEEWKEEDTKQVWDEKEIYLLNWTLCDIGNQGRIFAQNYKVGDQRLCGKTGTTDGPRDLSTILYYPNLVVGVWVGNNNNAETIGSGGQAWSTTVPLPMAHSFMSRVIGRFGKAWYSRPSGIVSGSVCKDTGLLAKSGSSCSKVSSVFIQGHLPAVDNSYTEKPICKETGKVATNESEAKALGLIEYKTYLKITLPIAKHQSALDSWLSKNSKYGSITAIPDSAICPLHLGPDNAPTISFTSPSSGSTYNQGDSVNLSVSIQSLNGVSKVEYFFDGSSIGTKTSSPYSMTYDISSSAAIGSHSFTAKVTDNDGKSGQGYVSISVTSPSPTISITMTSPGDGSTISLPQTVSATIDGSYSTVSSLKFRVIGPTTKEITASSSDGGRNWSASLTGLSAGSYQIYAVAQAGGDTYNSNWINVTVE